MSKKLLIIVINFAVVLIVTFLLIGKIKVYQGLKDVYVAKVEIRKGEQISLDKLVLRKVTLNREGGNSKLVSYYTDVITPANVKDAVGKYAAYDMIQDEIVVKAKLLDEKDSNSNYMFELPKGYYAYVINNTLAGGIVQVNDYIDLYVFNEEFDSIMEEPSLRHLRVHDLRDKDGKQVDPKIVSEDGEIQEVKYLVLALNDFQLKKLMYYENTKSIVKAAIRNRNSGVFNYVDEVYPYYAITSDTDLVDEEREKQLSGPTTVTKGEQKTTTQVTEESTAPEDEVTPETNDVIAQ